MATGDGETTLGALVLKAEFKNAKHFRDHLVNEWRPDTQTPPTSLDVGETAVRNHMKPAGAKGSTSRAYKDTTFRWQCFALVQLDADAQQVEAVLAEKQLPKLERLQALLNTEADDNNIWSWPGWRRLNRLSDTEMSLALLGVDPTEVRRKNQAWAIVLPTLTISKALAEQLKDVEHDQLANDAASRALLTEGVSAHSRHDVLLAHDLVKLFHDHGLEHPLIVKDSAIMDQLRFGGDRRGFPFYDSDGDLHDITHLISVGVFTNKLTREIGRQSDLFSIQDAAERALTIGNYDVLLKHQQTVEPQKTDAPSPEYGIVVRTDFKGVSTVLIGGVTARGTARLGSFVTQPHLWRDTYFATSKPVALAIRTPGKGKRYNDHEYEIVHQYP